MSDFVTPLRTPLDAPIYSSEFLELKSKLERAGLFQRQYGYYVCNVLLIWVMLAFGLAILPLTRNHGLYLLDATYLAFVFGQFGYLGHDGAHLEIFSSWRKNRIFCLIHGNLLLGLSTGWWTSKHNRHHKDPNIIALDGELEIAGVAFTEEQALNRRGVMRALVKYQAYTFFPLLALTIIALRMESTQFLLRRESKQSLIEGLAVAAHIFLYSWFVFSVLGLGRGTVFVVVHQVLFGLYMGLVFAPNHKGMPMFESGAQLDYFHKQVITARNVAPGMINDFCYGGLNYQIEHHLFPQMPRNRLRQARNIVKPFCASHGVPYVETGPLQSYGQMLRFLHGVSRALRMKDLQLISPVEHEGATADPPPGRE
jgi:fatty acid desaturase